MITVRADVYDALSELCYATGGIGEGQTYDRYGIPFCLWGHLARLGYTDESLPVASYKLTDALTKEEREIFPIGGLSSDWEVRNKTLGARDRLPWPEYCQLLGIVRGN